VRKITGRLAFSLSFKRSSCGESKLFFIKERENKVIFNRGERVDNSFLLKKREWVNFIVFFCHSL
jgi:hypothetical protein